VYDDSEDSQAVGEGSESQEEDAGADVIEIQSTGSLVPEIELYNIKLSVFWARGQYAIAL
jgi:hypothetical protein